MSFPRLGLHADLDNWHSPRSNQARQPSSLYSNKSPTAPVAVATHCFLNGLNKTQSSWYGIQLQQGRFYGVCNHRILCPSL
jgi:hypothetical protein